MILFYLILTCAVMFSFALAMFTLSNRENRQ
jgi:hypothetical protein